MTDSTRTQNTSNSHLGFASCAAVNQYLRTARDMKLDVDAALNAARVPKKDLEKESNRITGEQLQIILKHLIEQSHDPLLGLKSGSYVQPGSYGALGYITMSCATLGEAIERIVPYEKLVGDMGVTTLDRQGKNLRIQWHCAYPDPIVRPHMIDNVLSSWLTYSQWLANKKQAPIEVRLTREKPAAEAIEAYQAVFLCPVRFDQNENSILFPASLLEMPLRQPDTQIRKTMEDHAQVQMASLHEQETRLITRVKNAIMVKLKEGITRKDMVAEQLGLNARTLQRRLAGEQVSYQQLLDEVRQELAKDYLSRSDLPFQEIALRLGFSEARSFHRSFKGWTGETPGDYRSRHTKK